MFSIIIPVFNRPQEIHELLESLVEQTNQNFEVIIIEDGSSHDMTAKVADLEEKLNIQYFYKQNTGPGDSRNFGVTKASGNFLVFFDSDCLIPKEYFETVEDYLNSNWLDLYGGPDRAHKDFSTLQKAIDYSMTSFLTTGGIRGHRKSASTFQPRSFNMGISREAWNSVGGFSDIHPGEDPDLVYRLVKEGFKKGLILHAYVYHKRRIDFNKFASQVYKFGLARSILMKWHPLSRKWIFAMPSVALITGICLFLIGFYEQWFWYIMLFGLLTVMIDAAISTRSLTSGVLGVVATTFQIAGYGWGFLYGCWYLYFRKKEERHQFPKMFMGSDL